MAGVIVYRALVVRLFPNLPRHGSAAKICPVFYSKNHCLSLRGVRWLVSVLGILFLAAPISAQTSRQTNSPSGRRQPSRSERYSGAEYPSQSRGYRNDGTGSRTRPGDPRANPSDSRSRPTDHSTNAPDHTVRNPDNPASGGHSTSPATSITKKT